MVHLSEIEPSLVHLALEVGALLGSISAFVILTRVRDRSP